MSRTFAIVRRDPVERFRLVTRPNGSPWSHRSLAFDEERIVTTVERDSRKDKRIREDKRVYFTIDHFWLG